jgi:hypothetical protein
VKQQTKDEEEEKKECSFDYEALKRLKEAPAFIPKAKEVVGPKPQQNADEIGKI